MRVHLCTAFQHDRRIRQIMSLSRYPQRLDRCTECALSFVLPKLWRPQPTCRSFVIVIVCVKGPRALNRMLHERSTFYAYPFMLSRKCRSRLSESGSRADHSPLLAFHAS